MEPWNTQKSAELYNINAWGKGFFRINKTGQVEVTPTGMADGPSLDLKELVEDLRHRGLRTPFMIRFGDIVHSRIRLMSQVFQKSIEEHNYKGLYKGVYPVKVNQSRPLVDEMVRHGRAYNLGIEAGSKPELLVALAMMDNPDAIIVCNGFKDREYLETALLSQKLGRNTVVVIDRFRELELIIEASKNLNIKPHIGFRAKLDAKGSGKWAESSGAKSKFGLTTAEIVKGIELLKEHDLLDCLELLHFHLGSQVSALRCFKDSLVEASRVYVELYNLGAKGLKYIDVGGGLGVDYDGSQTNWENSVNYTVQEYANDVVYYISVACDEHQVPHPHIVTESGRALSAYHTVLIFDVVGSTEMTQNSLPPGAEAEKEETIAALVDIYNRLSGKNLNETIQDAIQLRDEALNLFRLGYMNIKQRAMVETVFQAICTRALQVSESVTRLPEEIKFVKDYLVDNFYGNFSIFKSCPDTWAVKQLFPIMPIHRLNEKPERRGIILDLTCDSDGKLDRFIDIKDVKESLELHTVKPGEPYFMGMFLLGAYQETLGDFHNLFGDTDAVHVSITSSGYVIDHIEEGDTVNEVLQYVEYDRPSLIRAVRKAIEESLNKKTITIQESRLMLRHYEDGLNGYTYLDPEEEEDLRPLQALRKINEGNGTVAPSPTRLTVV